MAAISFSVSVVPAFLSASTTAMPAAMPPAVKKSGGAVVALLVLGHQPVVHRVLGDVVVVIGGALHAGQLLVGLERRQDVAAGGELDAEALRAAAP